MATRPLPRLHQFTGSRAAWHRAKANPAGAGRSPLHFGWRRRVTKVQRRGGGPATGPGWGETGLGWENPSIPVDKSRWGELSPRG